MKLLVVTQRDEVRAVIEHTMKGSRDEVLFASDLGAGLALAVDHTPELAVIDCGLAGGAALAMVHHVSASSPTTTIHVLAAPVTFETAAEALSLGASGILVAPVTGDAILRIVADVHARLATEQRVAVLTREASDAAELVDAMTQALLVARTGVAQATGEALLTLFLVASGARGVAVYGAEDAAGVRPRLAGYGTALELLDRYSDLDLAQIASTRGADIVGLAAASQMYACVLLEKPVSTRTARVHRVTEFATGLLSLGVLARTVLSDEATAPRSRALPLHVFERLVQREIDTGAPYTVFCAVRSEGDVDAGLLAPVLSVSGAASGVGDHREAYVLLPKTTYAEASGLRTAIPIPVGIASGPADGGKAATVLARAYARAKAPNAFSFARGLRNQPLDAVIDALTAEGVTAVQELDATADALESAVLHLCRAVRGVPSVSVVLAHGVDGAAFVSAAQLGLGDHAALRTVRLTHDPKALAALVLTPRAGWGTVAVRNRRVHTSDPYILELLRSRLAELS